MNNNQIPLFKFALSLFCLFSIKIQAQPLDVLRADTSYSKSKFSNTFLELKMHYGRNIPNESEMWNKPMKFNPYSAFDIRLGWKAYGQKRWHRLYNYPSYGVGWYSCSFIPSEKEIGNPNAIYLWYNQPFLVSSGFQMNADLSVGLSFNFSAYDPQKNPYQTAIGSEKNVHFSLNMEAEFLLSERWDMGIGGGLVHFSNGGTRTPQDGLNLLSIDTKFRYHFHSRQRGINPVRSYTLKQDGLSSTLQMTKRWEFYTFINGGVTTPHIYFEFRDVFYRIISFGLDGARHYSYSGKIVTGFDVFYDESIAEDIYAKDGILPASISSREKFIYGVHVGHELMVHRWTLVTQLGLNLNNHRYKGSWYGRFGMRFDVLRNVFLRVALKIPNGFRADFIEWGGGFNFYLFNHTRL